MAQLLIFCGFSGIFRDLDATDYSFAAGDRLPDQYPEQPDWFQLYLRRKRERSFRQHGGAAAHTGERVVFGN